MASLQSCVRVLGVSANLTGCAAPHLGSDQQKMSSYIKLLKKKKNHMPFINL